MDIRDRFQVMDDLDEKMRMSDMEEFVNAVEEDFMSGKCPIFVFCIISSLSFMTIKTDSLIREDLAHLDTGIDKYNAAPVDDASEEEMKALSMLTR